MIVRIRFHGEAASGVGAAGATTIQLSLPHNMQVKGPEEQ